VGLEENLAEESHGNHTKNMMGSDKRTHENGEPPSRSNDDDV